MRGASLQGLGMPCDRDWASELASLEGRELTVILDPSNQCNIRCRMCHFSFESVHQLRPVHLDPSSFTRIARQLFPRAHTVYLSAASEPMTSPHFAELLAIAGRFEVPHLKFMTNGLLMGPEIAEAILAAGVEEIHVSVDGTTPETYEDIRRGGSFRQLVRNLAHLRDRKASLGRVRPAVQLNVTLMRSNLEELPDFVDLAEELGASRIAARHLVLYRGLGQESESLARCPQRANQGLIAMLERARRSDSVTITNFPDLFAELRSGGMRPGILPAAGTDDDDGPVGCVDHPRARELDGSNAVLLEGWALDRAGEVTVHIEREPLEGEAPGELNPRGRVAIGRARFRSGTRPDVAEAFAGHPHRFRSAWSFELRREALPLREPFRVEVFAVASGPGGRSTTLGRRSLRYSVEAVSAPYRFCTKPFDCAYVNASGDVYPHPDCLGVVPFGNVLEDRAFADIWFGERFLELRSSILEREPLSMCLTCPDFINRNVDDPLYFESRSLHSLGGIKLGGIEKAVERQGALRVAGWILFEDGPPDRLVATAGTGEEVVAARWRRRDLGRAFPHVPRAEEAGFSLRFPPRLRSRRDGWSLTIRAMRGRQERLQFGIRCPAGARWKSTKPLGIDAGAVVQVPLRATASDTCGDPSR